MVKLKNIVSPKRLINWIAMIRGLVRGAISNQYCDMCCFVTTQCDTHTTFLFVVSKENIQELLGDDVDEAYIDKLIAEADYLNDGRISYGEFKQAFRDQMRNLVSSIKTRSSLSGMFSDSDRSELEMAYSQSQ